VEFVNHGMQWGGTGWAIERRNNSLIVATNRHVAKEVARRKANGRAVFMRAPTGVPYGAKIDFNEEVDTRAGDSQTADVAAVEYLAEDSSADVALLRIDAASFPLPAPLELAEGEAERDHLIAVIGYPAYDSRNNDGDQARYFRDLYEVKRFAPGFVMQTLSDGSVLRHDATTLGGNSGSPVLSLEHLKVVGLHFSGKYGQYNAAVGVETLKKLLRTGAISTAERLPPQEGTEKRDAHHDAKFFVGREGFDVNFLGAETPWPGLPRDLAETLAAPSDNPPEPNELRYRHFGVKYSAEHKLPLITAVNIDGKHAIRIKRGDDQWFSDGRIPNEIQLGASNFADLEIDRGHMVRREDPNWDPNGSEEEAKVADLDTFHYVNACAQHSKLNQGKKLWQGLENYILDSARTHGFKACVFTGPILRPDDAPEDEIVIDGALVPLEYWKLVVTLGKGDASLRATAYVLSQGQLIRDLLQKRSQREAVEGFQFGDYRTFQFAVRDLAAATGYDFSAYADADPLARRGEEALSAGEPLFVPIEALDDLTI
ncbi:MAG: DNA/RNA non-specific endonuclease, partial [Pseudomonadota bacterium]|nr:DNA/RNA non-specific endonuclease [Pseudomonadota bacterium]